MAQKIIKGQAEREDLWRQGLFALWIGDSGTPVKTAKNWWREFCAANGHAGLTPGGARSW
jgi:hypothetical protein